MFREYGDAVPDEAKGGVAGQRMYRGCGLRRFAARRAHAASPAPCSSRGCVPRPPPSQAGYTSRCVDAAALARGSRSTSAGTILSRPAATSSASSPAAPTRPASGTRSGPRLPRLARPRQPRCAARSPRTTPRFCAERLGAEVVEAPRTGRDARPSSATSATRSPDRRPARPGHTASDQVETILFRLASSGTTRGIRVRRDDGVVRPLLTVWREETEAYCGAEGLAVPRRLLERRTRSAA